MDPLLLIGVGVAAFAASVMGGIAGIGTAIAMIPVLTFAFGVREAIPIITVAMLFNNMSRWWANHTYVDYRVVFWFSLGAVPFAILGGTVFANVPADLLARGLGVFLLVLVIYRHLPIGRAWAMGQVQGFAGVGGAQGFLSGIFGGAGPFGAHFFLAYGLRRNAFVGTIALATTSINLAKTGTYSRFALLNAQGLVISVAIGLIMVAGAYMGGMLVRRLPERVFVYLVESVMVVAGLTLVIQG